MATLEIREHASGHYSPRTYHNARMADVTAAFAADFSTAGERLTHKAAVGRYVAIELSNRTPIEAARLVYRAVARLDAHVLNVAGNGIYTLEQFGWSQDAINGYVLEALSYVCKHWRIERIVSGGQTGVDIAGIVAAHRLGIDAVATLPKGFVQRAADKIDR